MRTFEVALRIQADDNGINGSFPTPKKVKNHVMASIDLGHVEGKQMKLTALEVTSVTQLAKRHHHLG